MSQRFKVANRDWSISNVISVTAAALASSMIQAMNSTKHYAKWCWSPQKPQTIGNDQHVTPLTPNMKTGGMWFTFPQLAGGANVTFLNPSLDLSIAVERDSPFSHDRTIAKQKTGWHKESGRMEATATGTTTHIGGNTFFFSEVGRKTNVSDALKTKEGEFSP